MKASVAEGGGSKRVHGKWLTASQALACWGHKAVCSKAMVLFRPLLLSESSVWPGFTCCWYSLAWDVRKDALGLVLWGCLLRKAGPRELHELPGRHFAGGKDRIL